MLRSSSPTRRTAGRLMVVSAIAVALPLTASRAVEYLDVAVPAPAAAPAVHPVPAAPARAVSTRAPTVAAAAIVAAQPVAAPRTVQAPAPGYDGNLTIDEDRVIIDGKTKGWEDLTPAERARVRSAVAKARAALANTHIDQAQITASLAAIPDPKKLEEMQQEVQRAQANAAMAVNRVKLGELRQWGVNSKEIEANVRAALKSVQAIDMAAINRQLANIDRNKLAADVSGAQQSVERAKAELARVQARLDAEDRQ